MSFGFSEIRRQNRSDSGSESDDMSGIPSGLATGAILRERREAMGVTLEEAEASIRIRQKYLAAMESDEWHLLPGEIVGRGFLRNYAAYLDLEPSEMLERRRSTVEPRVAAALRSTSAGAPLPPAREVNYDPKELDLKDEPEGIESPTFNFRGILPILALALLAFVLWQGFDLIQSAAGAIGDSVQARIVALQESIEQQPVADSGIQADTETPVEDIVNSNTNNNNSSAVVQEPDVNEPSSSSVSGVESSEVPATDGSTSGGDVDANLGENSESAADAPEISVPPTATNTPEPPTPTPEPPTPTPVPPTPEPPTPVPEPPTPEPPTPEPVVVSPACPDPRSVITSPGQNQNVAGPLEIIGSATHETFDYYKLEYAPGDGSGGQWAYFDGAQNPIAQGRLGVLDTLSLANGTYTIRVVVVDLTANFPPPCQVTISIQN